MLDFRLLHPVQKLAGIGGKALDIAPLPFRVKRVKRQRRLAGTAQAGDYSEFIARQLNINILEIVLRRPLNYNIFKHSSLLS